MRASAPSIDEDYVSPTSLPGAVIDGKYRVDRVIGRGGVGLVVAATHLAMAQRVAIKMIRDDIPMQRELLDRFQREARAAAMIKSEHVARVLDVGRLPTGRPYIVMEYLEGEDLERVVARGPMPVKDAVDLALQACEALAEAHRAGIIHRDLKPANLFLTRRADGMPLVKVLDFGISKISPLIAARAPRGVETTAIMGSPGYMAPEQMKSTRDVDARADVWALGTVLYELLVGHPAFEGTTMLEILDAIAVCDPLLPSKRQRGIPEALDVVIARCLKREPEQRYDGIAELAVALQPFASSAGAGLADQALRISREPAPSYEELPFGGLSEPRPSALTVVTSGKPRSRFQVFAIGLVAFSCMASGVAFFASRPAPVSNDDSFTGAVSPGVAPASPIPSPPPAPIGILPLNASALLTPAASASAPTPPSVLASASARGASTSQAPSSMRKAHSSGLPRGTSSFGDRK